MDPSIILQGRSPNVLANYARGRQLGRQTAMEDMLRQNAGGLMQGDPQALNALAAYDPQLAQGMALQRTQEARAVQAHDLATKEANMRMQGLSAEMTRKAQEYAAGLSEAERKAKADKIERALKGGAYFHKNGDKAGYDNFLRQNGIDPAQYPFEQFPAIANTLMPVADILKAPEPLSAQGKFEFDKNAGLVPPGAEFKGGGTNVSIGKQETEYDKVVGKSLGEMDNGIRDAGMAAPAKISQYQQLGAALANTYTGAGADAALTARRLATAIGLDVGDVGDAELAKAIANRIALELRSPAGGAGMPGSMSDADREFLVASVPGLLKTPQGNAKLIEMMIKAEQRKMEVANLAQDYKDKNGGRLDYRFNRELTAWLNENPLFTGDAPPAPPPPPDQGQPAAPQGNLSPDISGLLDYYSQPQTTPFAKQSSQ